MTPESNSSQPNPPQSNVTVESLNGASPAVSPESTTIVATAEPEKPLPPPPATRRVLLPQQPAQTAAEMSGSVLTLGLIAAMIFGLANDNIWLGLIGAIGAIGISLRMMWPSWGKIWVEVIPPAWRTLIVACFGLLAGIVGLLMLSGSNTEPGSRNIQINWDAIGALGELIGALGQILIAILGVYVAWRQYVISKDLTIQQNRITQQQTIDAYFQGVSDLALDEQGFLEDWPQERAIAEGRTAAIMSSVDAEGKAKILRFLSQSRLVTPLKRDRLLGRPILDGNGGYAEDRAHGIRVIDLNVMLAGADMAGTDLRWTDLSEANLVRVNLNKCDLVKANLSRAVLYDANLSRADLKGARLFYGSLESASPRTRNEFPDYKTGENTGAVVERADFTGVKRLSDEQRHYCCAWCGSKSRDSIPGGCEGIPNKLGR